MPQGGGQQICRVVQGGAFAAGTFLNLNLRLQAHLLQLHFLQSCAECSCSWHGPAHTAAGHCSLLHAPSHSCSPGIEACRGAAPPDLGAGHCSAVWPPPPASLSQGETVDTAPVSAGRESEYARKTILVLSIETVTS